MEEIAEFSLTLCKNLFVEENDRLTRLPDDVLFSIMRRLTTNEAAQLSVLSHKWNKLWASYPGILNFEEPMTLFERRKLGRYLSSSEYKRLAIYFVSWIFRVVKQHVGPSLEEFKVAFDLDNTFQSHIDKWIVFALLKGVSSLELEFNAHEILDIKEHDFYCMPLKCCIAHKSPHGLKTLVLSHMEITAEVLECFLQSCPSLENLRMCKISSLESIRASRSLPSLIHFDVSDSRQLEIIDISAPKLFSFRYHGFNTELNIRNASSLSELSIGSARDHPSRGFQSLSDYFPQLEHLHLSSYKNLRYENLKFPSASSLINVKHLKLTIKAYSEHSLLGWMTLIEASPVLEKLTLELTVSKLEGEMSLEKRTSPRPLKCLRKLEVYGFVGLQIDIELITYVIENAKALEELFIDLQGFYIEETRLDGERAEAEFKEKLPLGAKLIINNRFQEHNYRSSYPLVECLNDYSQPESSVFRRMYKIGRFSFR